MRISAQRGSPLGRRAPGAGLVLLALACVCACGEDGDEDVQEHREHWERAKPTRYVVQTCTMGIQPPGCVRAAIDDGRAVDAEERIYAAGIDWERFEPPSDPLDDMFDNVRDGHDECQLEEVTYDESFGFVRSYALVCDGSVQGGRRVACFEPDALDLDVCDAPPEAE